MKKFIAFSGGVESSTMCVLYGHQADAIFADTGFEHQEIYQRIDEIEKFVKSKIRTDFQIHRIKSSKGTLIDEIKKTKFYPSFKRRYCTVQFKIKPIDDFLTQFSKEGCELMIGLNYDEQERTGNHGNKKFINYKYPLIELKFTREKCKILLNRLNLLPNFPVYMQRGGCIGCFYKSEKEYLAMALLNPTEFKIVEDLEEEIQDARENYYSIKAGKKMKDIRINANSVLFDPTEIYPVVNDATNCGVFCNR